MDGLGIPSVARLKHATLFTTPASDARLCRAIELQREGSADPRQHGRTPPLWMPKRELSRFLQRISDAAQKEEARRQRAAAAVAAAREKKAAAAAAAAVAAANAPEASAVLPAGTRRAAFNAGMR